MTLESKDAGGSPKGDQPSKGQDQVPLSDLIAVKRKSEATELELKGKAEEVETLTAKVEQLEADASRKGADTLGPEELEAARKAQFDAQKKLKAGQDALQKGQTELKVQQLDALRKSLVAQFGVEESLLEGMTDPKEMELAAMKKAWEKLASSKPADFDVSGSGGISSLEGMSPIDIIRRGVQIKKV